MGPPAFELPESRPSHLWSVTYFLSHPTLSALPLSGLIRLVALYTLLCSFLTISIRVIPASTETDSCGDSAIGTDNTLTQVSIGPKSFLFFYTP